MCLHLPLEKVTKSVGPGLLNIYQKANTFEFLNSPENTLRMIYELASDISKVLNCSSC